MHLNLRWFLLFVARVLPVIPGCSGEWGGGDGGGISPYNTPPTVIIRGPSDGSSAEEGVAITFKAVAGDTEDFPTDLRVEWSSSLDGILYSTFDTPSETCPDLSGDCTFYADNLSVGEHLITVRVLDTGLYSASDQVTLTIKERNEAPSCEILSPAQDAVYTEGVGVSVTAQVSDANGNLSSISAVFSSDLDGTLSETRNPDPSGNVGITTGDDDDPAGLNRVRLSPGRHTLTLSVEDPDGATGFCTRFVTVEPINVAPTVSVASPADGSVYTEGAAVHFTGRVGDDRDAAEALAISWASDLDGVLSTDGADSAGNLSFVTQWLSVGLHTVTLSVTDSAGARSQASTVVMIEAENSAPTAMISDVSPSVSVVEGTTLTVTGQVSDGEDSPLELTTLWTSTLQGELQGGSEPDGAGTVALSTAALLVGTHTLTLRVEDTGGLRHSASVVVEVRGQNTAPQASITAPAAGTYLQGETLLFTGQVSDAEEAPSALVVVWASDLDGIIPDTPTADDSGKVSFAYAGLSVGTHLITMTAVDTPAAAAADSRIITIRPPNASPSVSFTGPEDTVFGLGETVIFSAVVSDSEDAASTLAVVLTSDRNGTLCEASVPDSAGNYVCSSSGLDEGTHLITIRVTDGDNASDTDTLVLNIEADNRAPEVALSAPVDSASFVAGTPIAFRAQVSDAEDAAATLNISWESDVDGEFNTDPADDAGSLIFTDSGLSVGTHEVTLTVTDSDGAYSVANVIFTITQPNTHPEATITLPAADGQVTLFGEAITFQGEVSDVDDDATDLTVRWTSDRDGEINTNPPNSAGVTQFTKANLSVGTHLISLRVTDTGGLVAVASRVVTVRSPNSPPEATITAPLDGRVATVGDVITFEGEVSDAETSSAGLSVRWTSDRDGAFNTTSPDAGGNLGFTYDALTVGVHLISLEVTDGDSDRAADSITVTILSENTPPTAEITAPESGDVFLQGQQVVFQGLATDPDQSNASLSVTWASDLDGLLQDAASDSSGTNTFASAGLSVGTHLITLRAEDSSGAVAIDTVSIQVQGANQPPSAEIVLPEAGTFVEGQILTFEGIVGDSEDDPTALSVEWRSSLETDAFNTDGADASGNLAFTYGGLSLGTHLITLRVTDSGGLTSTDSVTINVRRVNTLPNVEITQPADGAEIFLGNAVTFSATASDVEDAATNLGVVWSSDLDGVISTQSPNSSGVTQFTRSNLSVGTHFVTVTVTDTDGGVASASVTVSIRTTNGIPAVEITEPVATTFFEGQVITFKGTATDLEDAETALAIEWRSNIDDVIGTDGADAAGNVVLAVSDLSVGTHVITLKATDSDGASATDTLTLTIRAANQTPEVTITAPSDASLVTQGDAVAFQATVSDAENAATALTLEWRSDLDGVINSDPANAAGVSAFSVSDLSVGTHTITLRVTDLDGAVGTDTLELTVVGPNQPPTASLTAPADSTTVLVGSSVTFRGTVGDTEDAATDLLVSFTSDIDGEFQTPSADAAGSVAFTFSGLSVGTHFVSLRVEDTDGAVASDGITLTVRAANTAPTATILTPADGSEAFVGSTVVFTGQATDAEDAESALVVTWASNIDGAIGSSTPDSSGNVSLSVSDLSVGQHTITLSVTDLEASTSTDIILLTVRNPNQAPSAQIDAPTTGHTVFAGNTVVFEGTVSDAEDAEDALAVRWSSNLDGELNTDPADSGGTTSFSTAALSVGQHVITLRVTDLDGASVNDTVSVTVRPANVTPTVEITGPETLSYTQGDQVNFTATASDPEDSENQLSYEFTSNLQGSLATGAVTAAGTISFSTSALSTGVHTITLKVTDLDGGFGTDDIQITVNAPNIAPTATLTAPTNGSTVNQSASVLFQGTGTDPEDAETALSWTLTSSIDGVFAAGNPAASGSISYSYSSLSVGTHTITLTVTDTDGDADTAAVTLTVIVPNQAPTVTITAPSQGATYEAGQAVPFSATAADADDAVTDLTVTWVSDVDGTLSVGPPNSSGVSAFSDSGLSISTHVISCTVEDPSGASQTKNVTITITPANTAPSVAITSPSDGSSVSTGESVLFRGTATDVESAETSLLISWTSSLDGELDTTSPDSSGNVSFSTAALQVGTHTIVLRAEDPQGQFSTASIALTVRQANRPPTQPSIAISPSTARTGDSLVVVITADSTDPDGDTVGYGYQWFKNGSAQTGLTTDTLVSSLTAKGEVWKVRVTPNDGTVDGPFAEASLTIANTAPTISTVNLTPTDAVEGSVLTVAINGFNDVDGDGADNTIEWYVEGALVASDVTTLNGDDFSKGEVVQVIVTPGDGTDTGTPVLSNTVTIGNTPPTQPTVAITPADPNQGENLVCTVTSPSTDVDGDSLSYTYEWYEGGVFVTGASDSTSTSNTLAASNTSLGEEWECVVTPSDGDDDGPSDSDTVEIMPDAGDIVITEVMISPLAVSDDAGEYVEVYNATSETIDLDGWVLRDGSADSHTISSGGVFELAPGERAVLARDDRLSVNGGFVADYEYNSFVLSNTADTIELVYDGRVVDTTSYTAGQVVAGRALTLDPGSRSAAGNDDPSNWCLATSFKLAQGDFGTPGDPNEPCACDDSDSDGDAFGTDAECTILDCDDSTTGISPVATDICEDGVDQNCDGEDASCNCLDTDSDGDGYGTALTCAQPDCDDTDANINPGETEACNGINDDCDGAIDEGFDADGDGFYLCSVGGSDIDCDDTNADRYPGNTEVCDDYDNDCDSVLNEGFDQDGDLNYSCIVSGRAADCDDNQAASYQGNTEICDAYDNNCDGSINEDLGDAWEDNNSSSNAQLIGNINDQFYTLAPTATIHSPDDTADFYSFSVADSFPNSPVNDGFYITATLSQIAAGANYDLYLYGPGGGLLESSTSTGNSNDEVDFSGTGGRDDGGTYIIEVRRIEGFSCSPYKLDIDNDD